MTADQFGKEYIIMRMYRPVSFLLRPQIQKR